MSDEQAKAFAEKALKDPAILEKLNSDGADVVAIAKDHGHEFDEDHIEAGQAHLESLVDEMSDEELNDIAGGMDFKAYGKRKTYVDGGRGAGSVLGKAGKYLSSF